MLPEHFSACHCCKRMSAHGFDTPSGLQSCCTISRRYKLSLRIKTNKNGGVEYTLIPKHEPAAHAAFHFLCIQVACAHSFHIARVAPPTPSRTARSQINWTRQVLKLASAVLRYKKLSLVNCNTAKRRHTLEGIRRLIQQLAANSFDQIVRSVHRDARLGLVSSVSVTAGF